MAVININDDGTNISLADSWEFDTTEGKTPVIIHISGHIFAVTYNDGTNRIIKTFQVADDGTITKSFEDTETFGSQGGFCHYIVLVSGSVYAVFSSGTDEIYTFTIDGSGTITAVDTSVFYTEAGSNVSPYKFKEMGGDSYLVYSIRTMVPDYYGYIVTLSISTGGIIGSVIDSQLINAAHYQYGFVPIEVVSGIFLFPWADTPGGDGFMTTLDIETIGVPTVTTDPATSVEATTATLNGTLDNDGGEACDCGFEWGETEAYGNTTPTQSRTTEQTFAQAISGLDPNKTCHFRAFATNSSGTGYGADRSFSPKVVISRAYALAREEL